MPESSYCIVLADHVNANIGWLPVGDAGDIPDRPGDSASIPKSGGGPATDSAPGTVLVDAVNAWEDLKEAEDMEE